MRLSVVIPAHNEADSIAPTVTGIASALQREGIDYEVVVVDDASSDGTAAVVEGLSGSDARVRCHRSHHDPGFGLAVRAGLERAEGDAVAIMMADDSDDPSSSTRSRPRSAGRWTGRRSRPPAPARGSRWSSPT